MGEQHHDNNALPAQLVRFQDKTLQKLQGGFTSIPNVVLENTDLTLGARMTYAMLMKYAWQKGFCRPAHTSIAKDLGVTDRSVRTYLNELKAKGYIDWIQQGLNRPNIYVILKLPEPEGETAASEEPENQGAENISAPEWKPADAAAAAEENSASDTGPENISALERKPVSTPDWKQRSAQDRNQASAKEDPAGEYPNTVTVNGLPVIQDPPNPGIPGGLVNDILDRIAEDTGDQELGSRRNFRKAFFALKQLTIEAILSETRTRFANGEIDRTKAQYFMWRCQEEAKKRGFLLWAPKPKPHAARTSAPMPPPSAKPFDVASLKGAVGNRGVMRDLKAYATGEEI
jgi:hypothetical protein